MQNMSRFSTAVALVVVMGCGDTVDVRPPEGVNVNVFAVAASDADPGDGPVQVVVVDRVKLVTGAIKIETAGVDATIDFVFEESRVIVAEPAGAPVEAYTVLDIPGGTYKEVEISIDKLEPGNPAEGPLIADHPELSDASIAVEGRVVLQDGSEEPFTFTAALDRDMEIGLDPVLVLTASGEGQGTRVSLLIRTDGWFLDGSGEWLDPRHEATRSAIEANIQASLEAFEDGDADGEPGPVLR
jgi:hypothetical protein